MKKPQRFQRKRTKGFRLPPDTICVDRSSYSWGNPFALSKPVSEYWVEHFNIEDRQKYFHESVMSSGRRKIATAEEGVMLFERYRLPQLKLSELRGRNLACFCKVGAICHGDVLLREANKPI